MQLYNWTYLYVYIYIYLHIYTIISLWMLWLEIQSLSFSPKLRKAGQLQTTWIRGIHNGILYKQHMISLIYSLWHFLQWQNSIEFLHCSSAILTWFCISLRQINPSGSEWMRCVQNQILFRYRTLTWGIHDQLQGSTGYLTAPPRRVVKNQEENVP